MPLLESRLNHELLGLWQDRVADNCPQTARMPAPVSRRGTSLVVEAVPFKLCPGDCIHCPHGSTTKKTIERSDFYSIDKTITAIGNRLANQPEIKGVTIAGPGEPALNASLGELIDRIKTITPLPLSVASCGSLFWRTTVQRDLLKARAVFASIDAADKETYRKINRYHLQIPFVRFVSGLMDFRARFKGAFFVNVCLVEGINSDHDSVFALASLLRQLHPTAVYLRSETADGDREPSLSATRLRLEAFTRHFGSNAVAEDAGDNTFSQEMRTQCVKR
jgi:wyosine [tRNA(Phe)-imidazoG37] synthetase (radical SAM superfamily)